MPKRSCEHKSLNSHEILILSGVNVWIRRFLELQDCLLQSFPGLTQFTHRSRSLNKTLHCTITTVSEQGSFVTTSLLALVRHRITIFLISSLHLPYQNVGVSLLVNSLISRFSSHSDASPRALIPTLSLSREQHALNYIEHDTRLVAWRG